MWLIPILTVLLELHPTIRLLREWVHVTWRAIPQWENTANEPKGPWKKHIGKKWKKEALNWQPSAPDANDERSLEAESSEETRIIHLVEGTVE